MGGAIPGHMVLGYVRKQKEEIARRIIKLWMFEETIGRKFYQAYL